MLIMFEALTAQVAWKTRVRAAGSPAAKSKGSVHSAVLACAVATAIKIDPMVVTAHLEDGVHICALPILL